MEEYHLPFEDDVEAKIARAVGELAHENFVICKYAVDFLVPDKTPVFAIKGGKVIVIKDDSDTWGLDVKIAEDVNFVAIDHGDGTYAEYLHLGKNTVKVKVGDVVKAGTVLGNIGYSGCMLEPHLHLNVFKIEDGKAYSITTPALENLKKKYEEFKP